MLARRNYCNDKVIADRAVRVYQDLYQDEYETEFSGQYVVIEVLTRRAYVAESVVEAIINAKAEDPNGLFHLIEIKRIAPKTFNFHLGKFPTFAGTLARRISGTNRC